MERNDRVRQRGKSETIARFKNGVADLPVWTYDCKGDCGFARRGFGFQCVEGQACGRYVHPGDPGYDDLRTYYDAAHEVSR